MDVRAAIKNRIDRLTTRRVRHPGRGVRLFYRVRMADGGTAGRAECNEWAEEVYDAMLDALMESDDFTHHRIDRAIDPYIALDAECDPSELTTHDERVREMAERDNARRLLPADVIFDGEELLDTSDAETAAAARDERANEVVFEVTVAGGADVQERYTGRGASDPIENARAAFERVADREDIAELERVAPVEDDDRGFAHRGHEVRVRAVVENGWPHVEWSVGTAERRGRGIGWVGVVDDEDHGVTNGRLYLDDRRNTAASDYFEDNLTSIPMPEPIAEAVLDDARGLQREAALNRERAERENGSADTGGGRNGDTGVRDAV